VVGNESALESLTIALFAQGHVLLEGVPGTAKTLMVRALSAAVGLDFGRIQFTPDLMPSDVVGTHVFDLHTGTFRLTKGPIFTEVLLADEINRAPAKTQSALLEAMQESQVSIDGERHPLSSCFVVFATQNPVEHEGTYALPEAQLDRFLLKVQVGYPSPEEEDLILARAGLLTGSPSLEQIVPVLSREQLMAARVLAVEVQVAPAVRGYIRDLLRATRSSPLVMLGAGPRAGVHLISAARWAALLSGRDFVTPDDVRRMLNPVICHRLVLSPEVELDGQSSAEVMDRIASSVEVPR
jgi:MoxR-like ATPase